ncbi:trypsin-like peptidase domain-containing protein [Allorhizocola rhizosphaerae]|uniref:trypsin-like peptidase domain-containing protein n=1 Tax=Allorhizocola rhizosphaerae TaxID=1872709 RepID=UPI000E3B9934|nr:trypsin-like peptidase domain-containing protein [Allorhizocola rhizosphaerae]
MPPRPTPARQLSAWLTIALISASAVLFGRPAVAVPSYTMEERAYAIAGPSLVYLEMNVAGFLRRKATGEALHTNPMVIIYRCTGFVVSSQGHVMTSTHCVQPSADSIRGSATNQLTADRIKVGQLTTDQKDAFIKDVLGTTEFTGNQAGSKPNQRIFGQLFQGQAGLTSEPALQAEVVESIAAVDGDVTLLKVGQVGLPTAEISKEPINVSAPVVLLAFGSEAGSATHTTRYKTARINGRSGNKTPPLYLLDGDLGGNSHGGMVVDSGGRVIGMINADLGAKDRPNRAITPLDHVNRLLSNAGVTNTLSPSDNEYRSGLNDYFGGRYADAIKKLDGVIVGMPDHSIAQVYRKQANERMAIEGDGSTSLFSGNWLLWAVIGLGVALLIAIGVIIWIAGRRRAANAALANAYAPISSLPMSAQPISVYPVSGGGGYDYMSTFRGGEGQQPMSNQDSVYLPPPLPAASNPTEQAPEGPYDEHGLPRGQGGNNPWGPQAR